MNSRLRAVQTRITSVLKSLWVANSKANNGIGDLRGVLAFGFDPDLGNQICAALLDSTGIQFCCLWDTHDEAGLQGNPELFVLDAHGRLHFVSDVLLRWLRGEDNVTENVVVGPREALSWMPTEMVTGAFDYYDGRRNFAVHKPAVHDANPGSKRLVRLSDLV